MTTNTLQRFDKDGIELVIDTSTGESFATISGYARMSLKDKSTISRRLQGVAPESVKKAEILTEGGPQGVALITEDLIAEWLPKDNPAMASQLLKLGVRLFIHTLAGYDHRAKPKPPMSLAELMLQSAQLLVEHEKKLAEQEQQLVAQDNRLAVIEERFTKVDESLKALPASTEEVPTKSIRSSLNELIRSYAYRTGEEYRYLWNNLYKEYRYRHHVDLVARAKNAKLSVCEYAEQVNVIDKLYALALLLYNTEE